MKVIKRALKSISHRWISTTVIFILLTIIFSTLLSSVLIFTSSNNQIIKLQRTIAGAVTIQGAQIRRDLPTGTGYISRDVSKDAVDTMVNDDRVYSYNCYNTSGTALNLTNGKAYYIDRLDANFSYVEESFWYDYSEKLIMPCGVVDSEYSDAFITKGFKIIEGRGITKEDAGTGVCLISSYLSEKNGYQIGDIIEATQPQYVINMPESLSPLNQDGDYSFQAKIIGIYNLPYRYIDCGDNLMYNNAGGNLVFIDAQTATDYRAKAYTNKNGRGEYSIATIYLKDPNDVDAYVKDMSEKLNVLAVNESLEIVEQYKIYDKALYVEDIGDERAYQLVTDRNWYAMVAEPLEDVNSMVNIVMTIVIIGIIILLALIVILYFVGGRRNNGILLSLGETRIKILLQNLVEIFVPVILALIISVFVSSALTPIMFNNMISDSATKTSESNQVVTDDYAQKNNLDAGQMFGGARTTYGLEPQTDLKIEMDTKLLATFTLAILTYVLLLVVLQYKITTYKKIMTLINAKKK